MQKTSKILPLTIAATSLALMGFGCNPLAGVREKVENKIGQKVAEGTVGALTGGKVQMDADSNNWQFKDNKTGNTVAIGEDIKLPDDFPKEVPIYAGAKVKSVSMSRSGDKGATLTLGMDDQPEKVATWYGDTLKKDGWSEESSTTMGKSEARNYKKGKMELSLLAFPTDDEGKGSLATLVFKPGTDEETQPTDDVSGDE